jgi:hypothetical protein
VNAVPPSASLRSAGTAACGVYTASSACWDVVAESGRRDTRWRQALSELDAPCTAGDGSDTRANTRPNR